MAWRAAQFRIRGHASMRQAAAPPRQRASSMRSLARVPHDSSTQPARAAIDREAAPATRSRRQAHRCDGRSVAPAR
jgi:hypothetical protein